MFYYSTKSKEKVVHYGNCHHLRKINAENLCRFDDIREARDNGYGICCCCSPLVRQMKKEEAELDCFCMRNPISYSVNKGNLDISTHRCDWKLLVSDDGDSFELHHENSFKREHDNSVEGFHRQKYKASSILGYLKYIDEHDYFRMLNPIHNYAQKKPAKKGTKRYKGQQKALAKRNRKKQIRNVLCLIESISSENRAVRV